MQLEHLEPRVLFSGLTYLLDGDVNSDGYVTASDAVLIARMVVGLDPPNMLGDLTGDGTLSGADASKAAQLGRGLKVTNNHGDVLDATIYDGRQLTVDGVLNVFAPDPSDMGAYWTVQTPASRLWGSGPSLADIQQGILADCYLLAAMGGLTLTHPADLMARITLDGTGFAVEFASPHVVVHVDARFSASLQVDNGKPLWSDVMEKAYAWYRLYAATGTPANTFASIEWGDSTTPYAQMGWFCPGTSTASLNEAQFTTFLASQVSSGYAVLLPTASNAPDLIPSHMYLVLTVNTSAGTAETWNSWGFKQTVTIATLMANDINWLEMGV